MFRINEKRVDIYLHNKREQAKKPVFDRNVEYYLRDVETAVYLCLLDNNGYGFITAVGQEAIKSLRHKRLETRDFASDVVKGDFVLHIAESFWGMNIPTAWLWYMPYRDLMEEMKVNSKIENLFEVKMKKYGGIFYDRDKIYRIYNRLIRDSIGIKNRRRRTTASENMSRMFRFRMIQKCEEILWHLTQLFEHRNEKPSVDKIDKACLFDTPFIPQDIVLDIISGYLKKKAGDAFKVEQQQHKTHYMRYYDDAVVGIIKGWGCSGKLKLKKSDLLFMLSTFPISVWIKEELVNPILDFGEDVDRDNYDYDLYDRDYTDYLPIYDDYNVFN